MPWYEIFQPNWGTEQQEPDSWQARMHEPDEQDWPSNETEVEILDETFYFDCPSGYIIEQCEEHLMKALHEWPVPQADLDECVTFNLDRCAQLLMDDLPFENGWLQVRACHTNEISCSRWSDAKSVPEPGVVVALGVACLILAGLAIWRRTWGKGWRG